MKERAGEGERLKPPVQQKQKDLKAKPQQDKQVDQSGRVRSLTEAVVVIRTK